jgi:predicted RNA-binding protein YlqC (UPF0109 family)
MTRAVFESPHEPVYEQRVGDVNLRLENSGEMRGRKGRMIRAIRKTGTGRKLNKMLRKSDARQ